MVSITITHLAPIVSLFVCVCVCVCVRVQICGVWKNLAKPLLRQLQNGQMRITMAMSTGQRKEVEGKIIKHRALFAGMRMRACVCVRFFACIFLHVCV